MTPTAIAGAYAKRLSRRVSLISSIREPTDVASTAAPATVAVKRPRRQATKIAIRPPAIALATNARSVAPGPSSVPTAASSFTSPPPIAPIRYPGNMSARPTRQPASASKMPTRPSPTAARPRPTSAMLAVSTLGTRRIRRSMAAAVMAATATTRNGSVLDIRRRNGLPEDGVDGVAHMAHRSERNDSDQGSEQRVLEQVLADVGQRQASQSRFQGLHVHWPLPVEIER